MMIRSFLPVGQGAFYCEQFGGKCLDTRLNIIYDCGSATDMNYVKHQIDTNFEQDEIVHAVFLSHLDADHINGIPYLLRYCRVQKIFFPLLTQKDRMLIKLSNMVNGKTNFSFVDSFMENPYLFFERFDIPRDRQPRLYQIADDSQDYNNIDAVLLRSGSNVRDEIFTEGDVIRYQLKGWRYIPYNFRQNERIRQLEMALYDRMGERLSNADVCDIWKRGTNKDREIIKAAYKSVKGSFNTNSMTLYSGNGDEVSRQYLLHRTCLRSRCPGNSYPAGCLYTGDYDASGKDKWVKLRKAYDTYWDNIGCVQIPHHGSRHNYNRELATCNANFVISAGRTNRYQHPHGLVVKDLLLHQRDVYLVTEDISSEVRFIVEC